MGFYAEIGLDDRFEARSPKKDRVDLVHIQGLEPLFINGLLDFLESVQPFEAGLKPSMRMALIELVQNFAEHSGSTSGAWAAGYRSGDRITLCLLDLGRGIPTSLRSVPTYQGKTDHGLIELATIEGVSSAATSRGRGLTTIRRFVRVNDGAMTIISGRGRVRFRPDRKPLKDKIDGFFPGTAAFLSLKPTERGLFVLTDEEESNESD